MSRDKARETLRMQLLDRRILQFLFCRRLFLLWRDVFCWFNFRFIFFVSLNQDIMSCKNAFQLYRCPSFLTFFYLHRHPWMLLFFVLILAVSDTFWSLFGILNIYSKIQEQFHLWAFALIRHKRKFTTYSSDLKVNQDWHRWSNSCGRELYITPNSSWLS